MTLPEEKQALRKRLLPLRRGLEGRAEKDAAIRLHVTALEEWRQAGRVLLYLSTRWEPDTWALLKLALAEGKEVLAPVCGPEEGQMAFFPVDSPAGLRQGRWGIWEPQASQEKAREMSPKDTICIVPGIAFDREGRRLGYGKGYYDRFLAARKNRGQSCRFHTVGLCYQVLFLDVLPGEAHDERVGLIVTEAGVCPRARKG